MKADKTQFEEPAMLRYTRESLPPRTEEDRARLRALALRPDSEIDTTDIPELTDEQLANSVLGVPYRSARLLRDR